MEEGKDALQTTLYSSFSFSWEIDFYGQVW